jgi:hypothetical protein
MKEWSQSIEKESMFVRCMECRKVHRRGEIGESCPGCGIRTETRPWPEGVVGRLFGALEEFFNRGEKELTVILACDFLELLLEAFFRDLFLRQRRPQSWIELTLKRNKSLDLRIKYLFKETLHLSFTRAIHGTPYEGFEKRWAKMRSAKGQLARTDPPELVEEAGAETYDLARKSLALFAWLNNRYCT